MVKWEKCDNDSSVLANSSLVLENDANVRNKSNNFPKKHSKVNVSSMGQINSSSAESQNADITGEFRSLFQLLQSAGFPTESCEHMPKACYREMTREWEQHCESGNHSQKRKK